MVLAGLSYSIRSSTPLSLSFQSPVPIRSDPIRCPLNDDNNDDGINGCSMEMGEEEMDESDVV